MSVQNSCSIGSIDLLWLILNLLYQFRFRPEKECRLHVLTLNLKLSHLTVEKNGKGKKVERNIFFLHDDPPLFLLTFGKKFLLFSRGLPVRMPSGPNAIQCECHPPKNRSECHPSQKRSECHPVRMPSSANAIPPKTGLNAIPARNGPNAIRSECHPVRMPSTQKPV
jgi:hypothetical protein